jgi:hypothetical protein
MSERQHRKKTLQRKKAIQTAPNEFSELWSAINGINSPAPLTQQQNIQTLQSQLGNQAVLRMLIPQQRSAPHIVNRTIQRSLTPALMKPDEEEDDSTTLSDHSDVMESTNEEEDDSTTLSDHSDVMESTNEEGEDLEFSQESSQEPVTPPSQESVHQPTTTTTTTVNHEAVKEQMHLSQPTTTTMSAVSDEAFQQPPVKPESPTTTTMSAASDEAFQQPPVKPEPSTTTTTTTVKDESVQEQVSVHQPTTTVSNESAQEQMPVKPEPSTTTTTTVSDEQVQPQSSSQQPMTTVSNEQVQPQSSSQQPMTTVSNKPVQQQPTTTTTTVSDKPVQQQPTTTTTTVSDKPVQQQPTTTTTTVSDKPVQQQPPSQQQPTTTTTTVSDKPVQQQPPSQQPMTTVSNEQIQEQTSKKKLDAVDRAKQFKLGQQHQTITTTLSEVVSGAIDLVKSLNSIDLKAVFGFVETINEAIKVFNPIYNIIAALIDKLETVAEVLDDTLPIVGSVMQILQGAYSSVTSVINAILRISTAKTLLNAKGSQSDVVKSVATYSSRKVIRSVVQKVYDAFRSVGLFARGVANLGLDIAAAFSLGTAEIGRAVTLSVGILDGIVRIGEQSVRGVKGIIKAFSGIRGIHRKENATKLVEAAIKGDTDAQMLIINLGAYSIFGRIERLTIESTQVGIKQGKSTFEKLKEWYNKRMQTGNENQTTTTTTITNVQDEENENSSINIELAQNEAQEFAQAYMQWGSENLDELYKWFQKRFSKVVDVTSFFNLLKNLFFPDNEEKQLRLQELQGDIQKHGGNKETAWKKGLILYLAKKFKSS